MTAYFILILLSVGIMQIYERAKDDPFNKNRKLIMDYCIIFTILSFVLFFGFRAYSVGTDTMNYLQRIFIKIDNIKFTFVEPLYLILNIVIAKLGGDYTSLLILLGFVMFIPLVISITKLSNKPSISMFLFITLGMFCQSMNAMRQYIALVYILLGLTVLLKYKWGDFAFIGFVVFAILFHKTAIVSLLLIPLKYLKLNWKTLLAALVFMIVALLLAPYIIKLFDSFMNTDYYNNYVDRGIGGSIIENVITIIVVSAATIGMLIFKKLINRDDAKKYDFFVWMFVLFGMTKIISIFSIPLIDRVGIYFFISIVLIAPIILKCLPEKLKTATKAIMVVACSLFFIYLIQIRGAYGAYPYSFV